MRHGIYIRITITISVLLMAAPLTAQDKPEDQFEVELGRSAEEYFNLGNWYADRDQHFKAIAYYRAAVRKKADFSDAWVNMGSAYRAVGRHMDAVNSYQKAIGYGSDQNFVFLNLGNALVSAKRLREATIAYRAFTELEPFDPDGYKNLGLTLFSLKDYAEAAKAFEKILLLRKDDSYFYYQTARCYALLKQYDKTLENVTKALDFDPNVRFALMQENDFKGFRRSDQFKKLLGIIDLESQ